MWLEKCNFLPEMLNLLISGYGVSLLRIQDIIALLTLQAKVFLSLQETNKQKNQEQQQQNICVEICVFVLLIGGHSKYFIQYFHMHKYTP